MTGWKSAVESLSMAKGLAVEYGRRRCRATLAGIDAMAVPHLSDEALRAAAAALRARTADEALGLPPA
jgi:hypothetical protein